MRLFKFVAFGCLFSLIVEVQFRLIGSWNPKALGIACVFMPVYFLFVYSSSSLIYKLFSKRLTADLAYYFIYGFLGLMIEWVLIGNTPSGNPQASQCGMFSFWAVYACLPLILTDDRPPA